MNFRTDIRWPDNTQLFLVGKTGVQVPAGLDASNVREAKFVDVTGMQAQLNSSAGKSGPGGLSIVEGLVTAELTVKFNDVAKDWKRLPDPDGKPATRGPGRYQFIGSELVFDLRLALFHISYVEPKAGDDLSMKIFATLYSHELLHVLDEVDVVKNWLPDKAKAEPFIEKTLIKCEPYTYGTPSQTIDQVDTEFRTKITTMTHDYIRNSLWAPEVNRREGIRDSPTEYKKVQDVVDKLRAAQINRK